MLRIIHPHPRVCLLLPDAWLEGIDQLSRGDVVAEDASGSYPTARSRSCPARCLYCVFFFLLFTLRTRSMVRLSREQIAVAGELFTAEAKRRSLAGMLIEGACRDTETIARVSEL